MTGIPTKAERYDRLAALREDEWFVNGHSTPETRDFIEALYWAEWLHPDSKDWVQVEPALGWAQGTAQYRWRLLVEADLPRWEAIGGNQGCDHIMAGGPRAGEPCGKHPRLLFRVTNPANGEWRRSGWCSKHYDEGRSAQWVEQHRPDREGDPTPNPNRGGVLPCYLDLSRGGSWADQYRAVKPGWEPPKVGVCADEWPELARVHPVTRRPKLTLILGDAS